LRAIERTPAVFDEPDPTRVIGSSTGWTTGADLFDAALGGIGLDPAGVHEIRPAWPGDWSAGWSAAQSFALLMAARRVDCGATRPLLWCAAPGLAGEIGLPYLPGLSRLRIASDRLLIALPRTAADVLWVIEEGLRSEALSLVIGIVEEVALTPARRLSLAAARHATPALILTDPRRSVTPAVATRWTVASAPSGPHPLVPRAPGPPRLGVRLDRSRDHPLTAPVEAEIEWCDAAYRFHMAPAVADRTDATGASRRHPGWRRTG
jgi:protein ImuA